MARPVVGDRLAGRYDVRALATERQTGLLFRGFDEQIGVDVALRVLDEELLADDSERQAFVQKATRAKTLQHPNLIRLYDILVDDSSVFLVMQWAPGERLSQRLSGEGALGHHEARSLLRRVAAGIAHAHQHGVVIANLRPETIILYPDGLKLSNMGIAAALPRERFLTIMSERGAILELAPEMRSGADPDERADVFALARLARRLLDESSLNEAALAVLSRGLSTDPSARSRDIEGFVRELDAALDGRSGDRSLPVVPTGYDTERFDKLPEGLEETSGLRPEAKNDVLVESVTDRAQEKTVGGNRGSGVVELSSADLIEAALGPDAGEGLTIPLPRSEASSRGTASPFEREEGQPSPEITDVARRSPVRLEDSISDQLPTVPQNALPPRVPFDDIPMLPSRPEPALPKAIDTDDIPMLPSRPEAALEPADEIPMLRSRPATQEDEHDTNPRPKIDLDDQPLLGLPSSVDVPVQPRVAPPQQSAHLLPLVLVSALLIGMVIVLIGLRATRHAAPPIVVQVRSAPAPVTPAPAAAPPPVTPQVTALPLHPDECPLGMAPQSVPHPYCIDLYEYPGGHTIPRTQVSLHDAGAICESRGLRLCSDPEWEQACRGPGQASFPYGSSYDAQRCNTAGKLPGAVLPAGAMPRCRSASGAYDMSGNVAEWTQSGAQRGGSVNLGPPNGRCSHAVHGADSRGASDVGFRCCGDRR